MDIKLKNIKYSMRTKLIAIFLAWISFMSIVYSTGYLLHNQNFVFGTSYYRTKAFVSEYSSLIRDVIELNVQYKDEVGIAISSATPVRETPNKGRINDIRTRLAGTVNFSYCILNTQTGEIISNVNAASTDDRIALLKSQPTYIYNNSRHSSYFTAYYREQVPTTLLLNTPYEVHTAVLLPLKPGDIFYAQSMYYLQERAQLPYIILLLTVSLAIFLAALIYLIAAAGRKEKGGEIALKPVDRIYTDIHTLLVLIAVIASLAAYVGAHDFFLFRNTTLFYIAAAIILSIDAFVILNYVLSITRQIKSRRILSNLLISKLGTNIRGFAILSFNSKLFKPWILLLLLGYGLINGSLFFILALPRNVDMFWILLIAAFNSISLYYTAKSLVNLIHIMEAVKEVSAGNLDYELNNNEITAAFAGMADDLKNLQKGLKSAVSEAVKGERMKTELITNVSHDLKTPLTSIINYIDLLKKEELGNENARNYVAVLEEKSARLKQLIEDLIEASKASSGNLSVNTEKIDLHQLIMQAYGEYEAKLEKKCLDMRISVSQADIAVDADGKHLWRILENLMSNILKYSMPNSRVYINIDKKEKCGILTVKNISAFPLEVSPEQLTERFARGDASRSTEGSGLGLSIAQGLTQLQGGSFKIDIDGDLFKVTIEIPLWKD